MAAPIPAVRYIRMSTAVQEDSPDIQRTGINQQYGGDHEFVREYLDHGRSASKNRNLRVEFWRMISDLTEGPLQHVKVVCIYNYSRFCRENTQDSADFKSILNKHGIRVLFARDANIDTTTMGGRIMDAVQSEMSNKYSVDLGYNVINGRLKSLKKGQFGGGPTPYGLARKVTDDLGKITIISRDRTFRKPKTWSSVLTWGDDAEVAAVRFIFEAYDSRDWSIMEIVRECERRGFPAPLSGRWNRVSVEKILDNPNYIGMTCMGRQRTGEFWVHHEGRSIPASSVTGRPTPTVEKTFEPVVADDLFYRVQKKLADMHENKRRPRGKGHGQLTGVLMCGHCGRRMASMKTASGRVRYHCNYGYREAEAKCGGVTIYEDEIAEYALSTLQKGLDQKFAELSALPAAPMPDETAGLYKELGTIKARLAKAEERMMECDKDMLPRAQDHVRKLESAKSEIEGRLVIAAGNPKAAVQAVEDARRKLAKVETGKYVKMSVEGRGDVVYCERTEVEPSAVREMLRKLGASVSLWWEKGDKTKWRLKSGEIISTFDAAEAPVSVGTTAYEGTHSITLKLCFSAADVVRFYKESRVE